jgi:hypothetical protein
VVWVEFVDLRYSGLLIGLFTSPLLPIISLTVDQLGDGAVSGEK